jgi:hypothetical protein
MVSNTGVFKIGNDLSRIPSPASDARQRSRHQRRGRAQHLGAMILGISCDARGGRLFLLQGGNNSRNFRTNAKSLQSGSFASFERDSAGKGSAKALRFPSSLTRPDQTETDSQIQENGFKSEKYGCGRPSSVGSIACFVISRSPVRSRRVAP